jgi:dTDP-4-dehydrorhamnose reductase
MKDVLILGSDGKLGSGLMRRLEIRARGTTRRANLLPHEIFFDLLNQESIQNLKKISDYRFAIIVAAVSDPDQCYINQKLSHSINVDSTISVLKILKEKQIKPIFISTEMVFNGNGELYSEFEKPEPILIYGRQKLEVERYVLNNFDDFMILRLSKMYSSKNNDKSILYSFFDDIFSNKKATYAKDQYFSPTLQDDFEISVLRLIEKDLSGVFHISSSCRVSRWDLFELFADAIGNFGQVRPCLLSDIKFLEKRPNDLSLNGKKLSKAIDFVFTTPRMGIDKWISENYSLPEYNGMV